MMDLENNMGEVESDEDLIEEDYDIANPRSKVDKILKKEIKEAATKFKPAEGVKFVEYDMFGFPKTEEMS